MNSKAISLVSCLFLLAACGSRDADDARAGAASTSSALSPPGPVAGTMTLVVRQKIQAIDKLDLHPYEPAAEEVSNVDACRRQAFVDDAGVKRKIIDRAGGDENIAYYDEGRRLVFMQRTMKTECTEQSAAFF